jgi:membrane protein YdbS with pleckstrin-like domain
MNFNCPSCSTAITAPHAQRTAAAPPPPAAKRNCPFCGEEILAAAKVCRYCNKDLADDLPEQVLFEAQPARLYYTVAFISAAIQICAPLIFLAFMFTMFMRLLGGIGAVSGLKGAGAATPNYMLMLGCPAALITALLVAYYFLLQASRANTRFIITTNKLTAKWEILSKHTREVPIKQLQAVKTDKPFLPRLLGMNLGSLRFSTASAREDEIVFFGIEDPEKVKTQVENLLFRR